MFLIITMLTQLSVICKDSPYERGLGRYIGPEPGKPRRDTWIYEGPHNLGIDVLFWSCFVISTIFSSFRKMIM